MNLKDKTAVIILNYNTWQDTLKEIDNLKQLYGGGILDIIVVDNNSPNASFEELSKVSAGKFTLIKSEENKGYAAGNNIALKYCFERGYKYGWILNNDVILDDGQIVEKLLKVFENDGSVAVVNPDIYASDGHMFNRDAKKPSFYDLTFGMFSYRKKGRKVKDLGGYAYVYRPQGCCMMTDLEKLHEVGFMDEKTFLYCEEMILAERLNANGYKCACCLESRVIHNHSTTVKSSIKKREIKKIQLKSFNYYLKEYRNFGAFKRFVCRRFYSLKLKLLK